MQRLHGVDEERPLPGRQLHDLAARINDRLPRDLLFGYGQLPLGKDGLAHGLRHRLLQRRGPAIESRAVAVDAPRKVDVAGEGVIAVQLVDAVIDGVGQGILLGVDLSGLEPLDRRPEIHHEGYGTHEFVGPGVHLARERADLEALHVRRRVHRPDAVRNMAVAVFEVAEDAVPGDPLLDGAGHVRAECAVHRGPRLLQALEQEGKVDEFELRHAVRQVAGGLIGDGHDSALAQPEHVLGLVAEVHHIPHVPHVHLLAELRNEAVADHFERAAVGRRCGAVAPHADLHCHSNAPFG